MATRRPSLLGRALTTPPPTPHSAFTTDEPIPSKVPLNLLTPPTSPIRSRSSSNISQLSATSALGQPRLGPSPQLQDSPTGNDQKSISRRIVDDTLICPFDVDLVDQNQAFGYGAWSTVLKGTVRSDSTTLSSTGLATPPSSPMANSPTVVAVKQAARSDAIFILRNEAKILTYISSLPDYTEHVVEFHGIISDQNSLVMSAIPFSLEEYVKRCSAIARRNLTTWNMSQPVIGLSKTWLMLARSMVTALYWLHNDAGVIHGDIKPANFLLKPKVICAEDEIPYEPVFIDFSSSHRLGSETMPLNALSAVTREYTAPELLVSSVLRDPKSTGAKSSDVFSLAVTLLVAATGNTMVYPGSVFQRQAMATQGWQVLNFVRSGDDGVRVPRHGIVEQALQKAVLKADLGRIDAEQWVGIMEDLMREEPKKRL